MTKIKELIEAIVRYLKSIKGEIKRITWPTKQELRASTIVVIITLIIITSFLWLSNIILSKGFGWVLQYLKLR